MSDQQQHSSAQGGSAPNKSTSGQEGIRGDVVPEPLWLDMEFIPDRRREGTLRDVAPVPLSSEIEFIPDRKKEETQQDISPVPLSSEMGFIPDRRKEEIQRDISPVPFSFESVTEEKSAKAVDQKPQFKELVRGSNMKSVELNPKGSGGGSGAVDVESESESKDNTDESIPEISVEELQADITTYVKDTGLEGFFAPDDRFLQDLAKNAAALKDDPLGTSDNINRLTCLSLYQLVIYCDDSSSMSEHDRYQSQQELVGRIAAISTKIIPDNLGVELRFINANDSSNMSAPEIKNVMAGVVPDGGTQIGTNLRKKILQPLVYDVLDDAIKKIQRPLFICTMTHGPPSHEDRSLFKRNIVECTRVLDKHGYKRNAVTFCIFQIGDDKDAEAFLDELRGDAEIQDVLYCMTDRLDEVYEELKGNENKLDGWLLKTLTRPIMDRNE